MYMGTISLILTFLIKFLFIVFIVGLVGGLIVAAKNYIFTTGDMQTFKATFSGNKTNVNKETCGVCGKEVEKDWNTCPYCSSIIDELK